MDFRELLGKKILFFDGGMGTLLQERGLQTGEVPETWNILHQDVIRQILAGDAVFTKEHLGLTNVRYTLHLAYCRNDLLRISNREEGGARVEIRIPDGEEGL